MSDDVMYLQGAMLAEGLPRSLRKAVSRNRVPNDIEPDLLFLASLLDPLVEKIKAMAPDLPEKAKKAREQIEPAAEKAYKVQPLTCMSCHDSKPMCCLRSCISSRGGQTDSLYSGAERPLKGDRCRS